ncbi:unnamed protein product [Gongylonema pulchrum]|uniref:RPN13_C domain-containing protein n=1 Tax=Gongylonema pulchrum TaxID=637853 RepID=A0A183EJH3_9BILA|nr:unnamed protein product [Gongylonema pulchrum]
MGGFADFAYISAPIDLAEVLCCADKIIDTVRKYADRLIPHLPNQKPTYTDEEELEHTLRAPQFRQAVNLFGQALQAGQIGPVFQQFGIDLNLATLGGFGSMFFVYPFFETYMVTWATHFTRTEGAKVPAPATATPAPATATPAPATATPAPAATTSRDSAESGIEDEETNETAVREAENKKPGDGNMDVD